MYFFFPQINYSGINNYIKNNEGEKGKKKILDTNIMKRNKLIIFIYLYRIYLYSQFANNSNI